MSGAPKNRIPSLDGARAVSIALVIACHGSFNGSSPLAWGFDYGNLGVRIFFVISGFLITKLLLDERQRVGRISIARFYLRRAFRILPAAYVYIATIGWLMALEGYSPYARMAPPAFYFANYKGWDFILFGHFWSLSVEEQFYLLWPAALVFLGTRRARYACVTLLFTAPLFRMLSAMGLWPTQVKYAFESVCDALATGCLLALLRDALWRNVYYRSVVESPMAGAIAVFGGILSCAGFPDFVRYVIGIPLLNVGIAMVLDRYMRLSHKTIVGRALNLAPVVWVGTISYSLYLWQEPWMFSHLPVAARICGAIACATASFWVVERPALRLRARITERLAARRASTAVVSAT